MSTFNPRTRQLAFFSGETTNLQLQVVKNGSAPFSRMIARGNTQLEFGPCIDWGPRNDRVFAAYCSQEKDAADAEYGVVEIPLNSDPVRWNPLFRAKPNDGELMYAQSSLSHDGRTWAMATAHMPNQSLKLADRALYLVDVESLSPKITKVPIPVPAGHRVLRDGR